MSKTAEEVGLIVGGIAIAGLSFGLGAAGIIAMSGAHSLLFSTMLGIGVSTAMSGVGVALRPNPASVGTPNKEMFASGDSPRRVIYGQFQTSGVLTYASFPPSQNQSTTNQYLQLIYTLTGHEISSFDGVVIDGTTYNFGTDLIYNPTDFLWHLFPGSNSSYNDFYWQHVFFEFDFGRPQFETQPFPALAAADSSWNSDCLQLGCAKVHVVLRADSDWTALFPAGQIPNIQFLVTGKKLIDPRVATAWQASTSYLKYQYTVDNNGNVWVQTNTSGVSGGTRPNFEGVGLPPQTLVDGSCSWTWYYGTDNVESIDICSSYEPQGNLYQDRLVNDGWQPGLGWNQYVIIEAPIGYLQLQTAASPTGGTTEPNWATTLGGVTADGTASWTCLGRNWHAINPSNSALIVNDYLQDTDYGMAAPASSIDETSVIAAANVCEEPALIIWNSDNTVVYENLYSSNGMFDFSSTRGNVLDSLCQAMAGWVIPPGDMWHIFAGSYVTPVVSLGDDDMRGGIKGDFRISRRDVANSVKGKFVPAFLPANPAAESSMTLLPAVWQSQSFPAYQANGLAGKPDYLNTEDGGQIIWLEMQLDFCTSLWQAQRLAKIALMRLRFQETMTLPCKLSAFQLEAGDTFYYTHDRWGILDGTFEVTQWSLTMDSKGGDDDAPVLGVDLVARQVDPSIYEFQGPSSASDYGEYSPYGITGVMTGVE